MITVLGLDQHLALLFDAATDHGAAKDVPREAHRRFRADLRVKAGTQSRPTAFVEFVTSEPLSSLALEPWAP